MKISKKHHFVPRSILKHFHNENEKLYAFDKLADKAFLSNADNVACENDFNSIITETSKLNFEEAFQEIDNITAYIVRKITVLKKSFYLSHNELYQIALITAVQQLRTKLPRTSMIELAKEVNQKIDELNKQGQFNVSKIKPLVSFEEEAKLISLSVFENIDERLFELLKRGIVLFKTTDENPFWCSDNPVTMSNQFPYGRIALKAQGTDIYFPVTKNITIGFICRNTCEMIFEMYWKSILTLEPLPRNVVDIFEGIYKSKIIEINKSNVDYFNFLQVKNSSRFLYSNLNSFEMASNLIKKTPQLKQITKTITIANRSEKFESMPMGEYMVFYLDDRHFMIPVYLISYKYGLEFFASDKRLEDLFEKKIIINSIEIFKNKVPIAQIRELIISDLDKIQGKIKMKHHDEGLNAIINFIKLEKEKR